MQRRLLFSIHFWFQVKQNLLANAVKGKASKRQYTVGTIRRPLCDLGKARWHWAFSLVGILKKTLDFYLEPDPSGPLVAD